MKSINVIGAGFSGLTLAYELRRYGFDVRIFEKQERCGGLISTLKFDEGLVETAANAMIASQDIEDLFTELNLQFAKRLSLGKKRYIFLKRPLRWPLTFILSVGFVLKIILILFKKSLGLPKRGESVRQWMDRVFNLAVDERLVGPGLQGVFASRTDMLSATLVTKSLFGGRGKRGKFKGSVAPQLGMGNLIEALVERLKKENVKILTGAEFDISNIGDSPTIICTSAWAASKILYSFDPKTSSQLEKCEALPLASVTVFFNPSDKDLRGFGCVFPRGQGIQASGVLFNSDVFDGRSHLRSETWIYGGYQNNSVMTLDDAALTNLVLEDRKKLCGQLVEPIRIQITKWPKAIPHYSVEWEGILNAISPKPSVYLHGNYLGVIGLSKIYSRSKALASQIWKEHG